jgi:amino acid permease
MFKKRGRANEPNGFFAKHILWMATATLIGTIVGAGVLAIPYVVAQSGFLIGFIDIVIVSLAFLFLHLFMGEIVLRTKKQFQLTGYMDKYLGRWGKRLMAFSMIFGIYGALIAYIIGEGETLRSIIGVGSPLLYSVLFFIVMSFIITGG